jgi:two-component system, sensor histidine kinase and response regulator
MGTKDKEFFQQLFEGYKVEAKEHLTFLQDHLMELEKNPDPGLMHKMYRTVHSLKGASRVVKIEPVVVVCQKLEDFFLLLKKGEVILSETIAEKISEILEEIVDFLKDLDPELKDKKNASTLLNLAKELVFLHVPDEEENLLEILPIPKVSNNHSQLGLKISILIAEDSETQRLLLETDLKEAGYNVVSVINGVEALEALKTNSVDMVISDIEMPEMDGYALCRDIKADENLRKIPVMLLTSLSEPIDIVHGIECSADSFMCKPYNKDLLFFHINHILQNKRLRISEDSPSLFYFLNEPYNLAINPVQVTDLLLSVYMGIVDKHKKLMEANQLLNQLNEQKSSFLGMAAHDLRNPLSAILGYSQILMEIATEKGDKDSLKMLERIHQASQTMQNLIRDLLDVTVIESGKVKLELSLQDLSKLLKDDLFLVQKMAEQKEITLKIHSEPNLPKVLVDPKRFEQIFTNLVTNAIKFSSSDTTIEISLSLKSGEVIFSVKDQGQGISAKEMKKLFTPFQNISVKPTAGESSTGLGLSIVKKLVTVQKGRIWAESEEGKGSTFFVALPVPK